MKKIMFIASTGGHLNELLQLESMFNKYDSYLITEKTKSTIPLKNKYKNKTRYLIFGSRTKIVSYIFKLLANCFISLYYYLIIRPEVIITTGTHTAGPMCCLGKIFGSKIVFIETFANSKTRTSTGNLIYRFADLFLVQWESMLEVYPKAKYCGWIW